MSSDGERTTITTRQPQARRRIIRTCLPCHRAKRRCNRKKPCSQCLRRHTTANCVYEAIAPSDLELLESEDTDLVAKNAALRSRLHDLEAAAKEYRLQLRETQNLLAQEQRKAASSSSTPSASSAQKDENGVYYGRSYYLGGPAAPDLLQQMMSLLPDDQTDMLFAFSGSSNQSLPMVNEASYLFPTFPASYGVEHMLGILYEIGRPRADQLLDSYYELVDPLHHYVPTPWLMQRYERCWCRGTLPKAQEVALVFAILALGDLVSENEKSNFLLSASMQLLRISNMLAMPTLDTIHSFCYIAVYMQHQGKLNEYWPLMGLVIRLAQSLALHRDPSTIPLLPPEEWEIRRRLFWVVAAQETALSLMFGRQYGIGFADCKLPLNVTDEELFNASSTSTREHAFTEISYHRLTWELGEITREIMGDAFRQKGPGDVNRLKATESRIRRWHESIPTHFKFDPATKEPQDWANLESRKQTVQAVLLHIIINHNILVLFRKSVLSNGGWDVRRPCYEAAFSIAEGWKVLQDNFPKMAQVAFLHWFRAFHGALKCFVAIRTEDCDPACRDKALASWKSSLRIFRRVQNQNASIAACWRALSRLDVVLNKEMEGQQRTWRKSVPKDVNDSSYNLLLAPSNLQLGMHPQQPSPSDELQHDMAQNQNHSQSGNTLESNMASYRMDTESSPNPAGVGFQGAMEFFYDNCNANIFDLDYQNWPSWLTDSNSPTTHYIQSQDPLRVAEGN